MRPAPRFRLYAITDRRRMRPSPEVALQRLLDAVPPGLVAVQLRERDATTRELLALGELLLPLCRARGAPLLINDRLDVARTLGADGVQLRVGSVPVADARAFLGDSALIATSCHGASELQASEGADLCTLGPIFETPSKRALGNPIGLAGFSAAMAAVPSRPAIFGLGGIQQATGRHVLRAGAHGLAAIGAFWDGDPAAGAAQLARLFPSASAAVGA